MVNTTQNTFTPDYAVPPGEILEEELEHRGMSQVELAHRTGMAKKTINEIIKAKAPITVDSALKIEHVFRQPAEYWLNLERLYQEARARQKELQQLESATAWLKKLPVGQMVKFGWIKKYADKATQLREILNFFGIASVGQWDAVWGKLEVSYRKSTAFEGHDEAISAWLRQGELQAQQIDCAPYDAAAFKAALVEIRGLTREVDPQVFVPRLREICAGCGVAVVLVPELPKTYVSGAARWLSKDKAIIQLSLRYKSDDYLWFTFFHEACHIIKHGKKALFLEGKSVDDSFERQANEFASNQLIPTKAFNDFISHQRFDKGMIVRFAEQLGISPGIVVGQLQYHGSIPYHSRCNDLKQRFDWVINKR
jgi:HTH-type transcriptional regulator/antitoxin HigA